MARRTARPEPASQRTLRCARKKCPECGRLMWAKYDNHRTVTTLTGSVRLTLKVRRCRNEQCPRFRRPYRPEAEGRYALSQHEFGLDVIAQVGALRYREHRSVPEIHQHLRARGVVRLRADRHQPIGPLRRVAGGLADGRARLQDRLGEQGRVILAIDGLQPDVGHEVLWVLRDCLSGEVLLARSLPSGHQKDLAALIGTVRDRLSVPIEGVISDGQHSIRKAVAQSLPDVPHQLCQFHYLREAARPIYEADRHAKKELKKTVRGVRLRPLRGCNRGCSVRAAARPRRVGGGAPPRRATRSAHPSP